jgi:hypothetical protein
MVDEASWFLERDGGAYRRDTASIVLYVMLHASHERFRTCASQPRQLRSARRVKRQGGVESLLVPGTKRARARAHWAGLDGKIGVEKAGVVRVCISPC